ncbi:MAG: hypothetical protein AB8I08_13760 [Sandaracinaceae bacterium]
MKLAKGTKRFVVERRGTAVFHRSGSPGRKGVPKSKMLNTEQAADAHLRALVQKKLDAGYAVIDEHAGLDTPFRDAPQPSRPAEDDPLAQALRGMVQNGFYDATELQDFLVDQLAGAGLRHKEAAYGDVLQRERVRLRNAAPPNRWVNASLRAAFRSLNQRGVYAREGMPGAFFGSAPKALAKALSERPGAPGACGYTRDEVDWVRNGRGLRILCVSRSNTPDAYREFVGTVRAALECEGVDSAWDGEQGEPVVVPPFEWFAFRDA